MTSPTFNEEILTLALDSRARTSAWLANEMQVTPGMVSKWLHGTVVPSDDRAVEIAGKLNYPVRLFYRPERVRNSDSVCFHHRKRKSMPARLLQRIEAEMHLTQLQAKRMLNDLEIESTLPFLTLDTDEFGGAAETAQALRSYWRVPPGPIANLTTLVESAGAVVVLRSFGTTKLDGMSCWAKGTPPLFFLNADLPTDRQRWTLAHELGHLTMHGTPPQGDPEVEAEDFARELLLPAGATTTELRRLSFMRLPALKHEWRVPMKELITAAHRRQLLPPSKTKSLSVQYSRAGWGTSEGYPISPERPSSIGEALRIHLGEHGYTVDELAAVVDLYPDEFRGNFNIPDPKEPRLRVV
ncbi:MAG: ImmA/IrrE family metallo-endopeptidase [Ilumatobacteraceae bacterium]